MTAREPVPSPGDFRFRCPIEVRFRDIDAMGHVNNAVYLTYFENARAAWVAALDRPESSSSNLLEQFPFILAEAHCRFLRPVRLGERVCCLVRATAVGNKSFELEYLLVSEPAGQPLTHGRSTQIYFDYGTARPAPVPPEVRRAIEKLEGRAFPAP